MDKQEWITVIRKMAELIEPADDRHAAHLLGLADAYDEKPNEGPSASYVRGHAAGQKLVTDGTYQDLIDYLLQPLG